MENRRIRKQLSNLNDLKEYGIKFLTAEACAYSMRLLFDLDNQGKEIIRDFFSFMKVEFAPNWNSGSNGSIMLPRSIMYDLMVFCLLRDNEVAYINEQFHYVGEMTFEEYKEICGKDNYYAKCKFYLKGPGPSSGSRNIHVFSGRTT